MHLVIQAGHGAKKRLFAVMQNFKPDSSTYL